MKEKRIKIKNVIEFRRTLKSITNIPEMSLSPYILRSDMNLSELEYSTKYLYTNVITKDDFEALLNFMNKQQEENKSEIEKAKNNDQITNLINKLISLTSYRIKKQKKLNVINKTIKEEPKKKGNIVKISDRKKTKIPKLNKLESSDDKKIIDITVSKETKENNNLKTKEKYKLSSIPYTEDKASAFNTIIKLFKITSSAKEYDKLPVSSTNFYNLKSSKRNGKDVSVSRSTINKMVDYFSNLIKINFDNLIPVDKEILKTSFEIFSEQPFPIIATVSNNIQSVEIIKVKKVKENKTKPLKVKEPKTKKPTLEITIDPVSDNNQLVENIKVKKVKEPKLEITKDSNYDSAKNSKLTTEASIAFRNLCSTLKLRSHYEQKGGVPISGYTIYHWITPNTKGVNANKLLKVINYLNDIFNNGNTNNFSDEDWQTAKQYWEAFNSEISKGKKTESKNNSSVKDQSIDIPVTKQAKKDIQPSDSEMEFVLNHLELIKNKQKADQKLKEIITQRVKERFKRDRLIKIQDALTDMTILSTLALSKETEFSEKVYEIKDFVISNKRGKSSIEKKMKQVDFISKNPDIDSNKNQINLPEEEYNQYLMIKYEAEKDQGKVEIKLILDADSKLHLYLNYSY